MSDNKNPSSETVISLVSQISTVAAHYAHMKEQVDKLTDTVQTVSDKQATMSDQLTRFGATQASNRELLEKLVNNVDTLAEEVRTVHNAQRTVDEELNIVREAVKSSQDAISQPTPLQNDALADNGYFTLGPKGKAVLHSMIVAALCAASAYLATKWMEDRSLVAQPHPDVRREVKSTKPKDD